MSFSFGISERADVGPEWGSRSAARLAFGSTLPAFLGGYVDRFLITP